MVRIILTKNLVINRWTIKYEIKHDFLCFKLFVYYNTVNTYISIWNIWNSIQLKLGNILDDLRSYLSWTSRWLSCIFLSIVVYGSVTFISFYYRLLRCYLNISVQSPAVCEGSGKEDHGHYLTNYLYFRSSTRIYWDVLVRCKWSISIFLLLPYAIWSG